MSRQAQAAHLEGFRESRFHVIVELETENGRDSWTEEWFSRKQPAIEYGQRLLNRLAEQCPENAPKVVVYDSQGSRRDESKRTTYIRLSRKEAQGV